MKKLFKRKSAAVEEPSQLDLASAIGRIQQQLTFLEQKLDTLIASSSAPRPSQRFDKPYRRDRGDRDGGFRERSFTKAVCAECNTECEVPFKPTGDRPVYCKDCFAKRKEGGSKKPAFRKRSRNRAQ